ncbi:MAG TPA: hypothetical protein VIZ65_01790 [Cellvibrionaceae bacterium]
MGALGSGRPKHQSKGKKITDDLISIDVRQWQREQLLVPGKILDFRWNGGHANLEKINVKIKANVATISHLYLREKNVSEHISYAIDIVWTDCHLGGQRPWFLCPAHGCGQRVALLYFHRVFACRACHKLAYRCQEESEFYRGIRRIDKLRYKLGWRPGYMNEDCNRAKGMHWRTFEKCTSSDLI